MQYWSHASYCLLLLHFYFYFEVFNYFKVEVEYYARWDISGTRYQNIIHSVHGTKNPHHTNC